MTPTGGRGPGSNTGPPSSAPVVASWPELLAATGAEDVDGLSALVDDACEPDVWVADTDSGVEVGAASGPPGWTSLSPSPTSGPSSARSKTRRWHASRRRLVLSGPQG